MEVLNNFISFLRNISLAEYKDFVTTIVSLIAIYISVKQLMSQNKLNKTNIRKEKLKIRNSLLQKKSKLLEIIRKNHQNEYDIKISKKDDLLRMKYGFEKDANDFMIYYNTHDRDTLDKIISETKEIYENLEVLATLVEGDAPLNVTLSYTIIDEQFKKLEAFLDKDLNL